MMSGYITNAKGNYLVSDGQIVFRESVNIYQPGADMPACMNLNFIDITTKSRLLPLLQTKNALLHLLTIVKLLPFLSR